MTKITPIPKTNSLYSDSNTPFKCLVFFYKFSHIFFGLDFGFIEFKAGEKIHKILTFFQSISLCFLIIIGIVLHCNVFMSVYFVYIIQYLIYVLILIRIKKGAKFSNLIQDLRTIDLGLKVNHATYNLEIKLFLSIFVFFAYRVLMTFSSCWYYETCCRTDQNSSNGSLYVLVLMAVDVVRITYAYMFYAITCRLGVLGSFLKTKQSGFLSVQYLYRSIVDIAEQHKEAWDPVLIAALLINVPQTMATMFLTVQKIKKSAAPSTFTLGLSVEYFTIIEMLLLTIMPAICASTLATQANNIKVILHDILLQQRDEAHYRDLCRFIRYVEARGCRFRVCKVIPLDADLLGMVLSFCITYLIVIIQFTN